MRFKFVFNNIGHIFLSKQFDVEGSLNQKILKHKLKAHNIRLCSCVPEYTKDRHIFLSNVSLITSRPWINHWFALSCFSINYMFKGSLFYTLHTNSLWTHYLLEAPYMNAQYTIVGDKKSKKTKQKKNTCSCVPKALKWHYWMHAKIYHATVKFMKGKELKW